MKKKIYGIFMVLLVFIPCMLIFSACGDDVNPISIKVEIANSKAVSSYYISGASATDKEDVFKGNDNEEIILNMYIESGWEDSTILVTIDEKTFQTTKTTAGVSCSLGVLSQDSTVKVQIVGALRNLDCKFTPLEGNEANVFEKNLFINNIQKVNFYKYNETNPESTYTNPIYSYTSQQITNNEIKKLTGIRQGDVIIAEVVTQNNYEISQTNRNVLMYDINNYNYADAYPILRHTVNTVVSSYPAYYLRDTNTMLKSTSSINTSGARLVFVADKNYTIEFNVPSLYSGCEVAEVDVTSSAVYGIERVGGGLGNYVNESNGTQAYYWNVREGDFYFNVNLNYAKIGDSLINQYNFDLEYEVYAIDQNGEVTLLNRGSYWKDNTLCDYKIPVEDYSRYYKIVVCDHLATSELNEIGGVDENGQPVRYEILSKATNASEENIKFKIDDFGRQVAITGNGERSANVWFKTDSHFYEIYNTENGKEYELNPFTKKEITIGENTYTITDGYLLDTLTDEQILFASYECALSNYPFNNDILKIEKVETPNGTKYAVKLNDDDTILSYFDENNVASFSYNSSAVKILFDNSNHIYIKIGESNTVLNLKNYFIINDEEYFISDGKLIAEKVSDNSKYFSKFYFTLNSEDYYFETDANFYSKIFKKVSDAWVLQATDIDGYTIGVNSYSNGMGNSGFYNYIDGVYKTEYKEISLINGYCVGNDFYSFDGFNIYKNNEKLDENEFSNAISFTNTREIIGSDYYKIRYNRTSGFYEVLSLSNQDETSGGDYQPLYDYGDVVATLKYYDLIGSGFNARLLSYTNDSSEQVLIYDDVEYTNLEFRIEPERQGTTQTAKYEGLGSNNPKEIVTMTNLTKYNNGLYDYYDICAHIYFDNGCELYEYSSSGFNLAYIDNIWKVVNNNGEVIKDITNDNIIINDEITLTLKWNEENPNELISVSAEKSLTKKISTVFYFNDQSKDQATPTRFEYVNFSLVKTLDEHNYTNCFTTTTFSTDIVAEGSHPIAEGVYPKQCYTISIQSETDNLYISSVEYAKPLDITDSDDLIYLSFLPHPDLVNNLSLIGNGNIIENVQSSLDDNKQSFNRVHYMYNPEYFKQGMLTEETEEDFYAKQYNRYKMVSLKVNDYIVTNSTFINLLYKLESGSSLLLLTKSNLTTNGFTSDNAVYAIYAGVVDYAVQDPASEIVSFALTPTSGYITFVFDMLELQRLDQSLDSDGGLKNIYITIGYNYIDIALLMDENKSNDPIISGFTTKARINVQEEIASEEYQYYNGTAWVDIEADGFDVELGSNVMIRCKNNPYVSQLTVYESQDSYINRNNQSFNSLNNSLYIKKNEMTNSNSYDGTYAYYILPIVNDNCYIVMN